MQPARNPLRLFRLTPSTALEYIAWWLAALLFLASCTAPTQPVETPFPDDYLPTAVALTIQAGSFTSNTTTTPAPITSPILAATEIPATPTKTASASIQPAETTTPGSFPSSTRNPSRTPSPTPTPEIPIAIIQILSPGPASLVVSPIKTNLYMIPGDRGTVIVELFGEDSRLLVRKVLSYTPGSRARIAVDLEFEIPVVAEAGRLVISTEDNDSRVSALASVDLILLSLGNEEINPAGDQLESIIIREPSSNMLIQGGSLMVSGIAHPSGDSPLIIQLLKADGSPAGPSRMVDVTALPDNSGYGMFTAEVPYTITRTTRVRLVIYERAGRLPGITHLSSIEVLLTP